MSTSRPSLRRSLSSSSIPVLTRTGIPRPSIKSTAKKSIAKPASRPSRAPSLDRAIPRSSSASNLLSIPQFSRQHSGSIVSKRSTTPRVSNYGRSPASSGRKDNRPISDRSWQYAETVKVQQFVASAFSYLDHKSIKSGISVEVFVQLIDGLFKCIDRRFHIIREKYIEEVPKQLKIYGYPIIVKSSLLKTVNTAHSWPHVLAILSWLVDLITELNTPLEPEYLPANPLKDAVCKMVNDFYLTCYRKWNLQTEEAEENFDEISDKLNEFHETGGEQMQVLDAEIEHLNSEMAALKAKLEEDSKEIETLKAGIENFNTKCEQYDGEINQYEKAVQNQKAEYSQKIKDIDEQITAFSKKEEELQSAIALQPHSQKEFKHLNQEVQDLQHTLKYKKQKHEEHTELVINYDHEIMDLKQQMKKCAFQHNSIIYKLGLLDPNLKNLHIHEEGFARRDTESGLLRVKQSLIGCLPQIEERTCTLAKKAEELETALKKKKDELSVAGKRKEELSTEEAELELTLQQKLKQFEVEQQKQMAIMQKQQNKLSQLIESRDDIEPLKKEQEEWVKRVAHIISFKRHMQEQAQHFFLNLESGIYDNMKFYMNTMEETTHQMVLKQEKAIEAARQMKKKIQEAKEEVKSLKSKK